MARSSFFLLTLAVCLYGQISKVPYATASDGSGPTFSARDISILLGGHYRSIRDVDFPNLTVPMLGGAGKRIGTAQFKNGRYQIDGLMDHFSEEFEAFHPVPSASRAEFALALYSWTEVAGSSSQGSKALLFAVDKAHLRVVQSIDWDTHFNGGSPTDSFDAATNTLVIRSAHYIPGDAHCCVSAVDVVAFRWNGIRFVETSIRTELSEYGKAEGKTLPN